MPNKRIYNWSDAVAKFCTAGEIFYFDVSVIFQFSLIRLVTVLRIHVSVFSDAGYF